MNIIKPILITATIFLSQTSFAEDHSAGEKLFKANCAVCHGAAVGGMDLKKRIAPPIAAVRMHYIETYPDEASFVQAVSSWVEKQDKDKSLMRGAMRRFDIMPPITIAKEDAKKIAAYIYNGDIEKPEGFAEHVQEEHGKNGMGGMHSKDEHGEHEEGIHEEHESDHKMPIRMQKRMQGKSMGQHKGKEHRMHQMMKGQGKNQMKRSMRNKGMGNKMMRKLNLNPQQQQQMQGLIQEKESRITPLKQELFQIKKSINQLDTTSPDYKNKIFSLADYKSKLVFRIVVEKGEMRQKIESVLSAEQRQQFNKMRANRKKH